MTDPLELKYASLKDPGIRAFMIAGERFYPADAVNSTMAQQREFYDKYCAHFRRPRPADIDVSDFRVGDVACRLYKPEAGKTYPVMLYIHGGGYVLGSIDSHDDVCAEICDRAGIAVVGVSYRLAPEHPFPPTFMVAAELDPLHDDCENYATKLRQAGVPGHEPLLVHAFLRARHMSEPAAASFSAIVDAAHHLGHYGQLPPTGT